VFLLFLKKMEITITPVKKVDNDKHIIRVYDNLLGVFYSQKQLFYSIWGSVENNELTIIGDLNTFHFRDESIECGFPEEIKPFKNDVIREQFKYLEKYCAEKNIKIRNKSPKLADLLKTSI